MEPTFFFRVQARNKKSHSFAIRTEPILLPMTLMTVEPSAIVTLLLAQSLAFGGKKILFLLARKMVLLPRAIFSMVRVLLSLSPLQKRACTHLSLEMMDSFFSLKKIKKWQKTQNILRLE